MDNFWIFLLIIGAVASIAQKNQQKNKPSSPEEEPTLDPQAEWERHMREIFGDNTENEVNENPKEEATEGSSTANKPDNKPITTQTAQTIRHTIPAPKEATQAPIAQSVASYSRSKIRHTSSATSTTSTYKKSTDSVSKTNNPIKYSEISSNNSEIEQIIDDFTMEKAVIYSEILKPKFEEL